MHDARIPTTLPASWYWDPAQWQRERRAVFARSWLLAGHTAPLDAPGSALAMELAGYPVVVLRDHDGALRGFHNVCRHRAGPLLHDGAHHGLKSLRCQYHGWTYKLSGELSKASGFARDSGLDTSCLSLWPVQVAEWRRLLFVNLDGEAADLTQALEPVTRRATRFELESFQLHSEQHHEIDCNWKTYVDNYNEGYHIPHVHEGLARTVDMKEYRVTNDGLASFHEAPRRDGEATPGLWVYLFPNAALNIYPTGMNIERIIPLGPRKTRLSYSYFFADPNAESAARDVAASALTTTEDIAICLAVQRNLEAGVYEGGVMHPTYEIGNVAVQARIRQALESP